MTGRGIHQGARPACCPPPVLLALALAACLAWSPLTAEVGPGRITLKSGDVIGGDVAKTVGDNYIIRTPAGLRVIPRGTVERAEPGVEIPDAPPPPPRTPRGTVAGASGAGTAGGNGTGATPAPEASGKRVPSGETEGSPGRAPAGGGEEKTSAKPATRPAARSLPDQRLDLARSGGPPPVLEIALSGSLQGKPLNGADPFTVSRLTYFLGQVSRPRFDVQPPGERGAGKSAVKKAGAKEGPPSGATEYRAELSAQAWMEEITFYGTSVLKTFRCRALFRLVRASDKKVIEEIEVLEDEGGDPSNAEELCRKAYNRAVESLLKELKGLPAFGGRATGTEDARAADSNHRS